MFKKCTLIILIASFFTLHFAQPQTASACEYTEQFNWRYTQKYKVDRSQQPPGLTIRFDYTYNPQIGTVRFELDGSADSTWFLQQADRLDFELVDGAKVPAGANKSSWSPLDPNRGVWTEVSYLLDIEAELSNARKPVPANASVPDPDTFELAFVQGEELYLVPIEVTYKLNPAFKDQWLDNNATVEDFAQRADLVAVGVARTRDNRHLDNSHGNGTITVGSWLKGSGPKEIEVASFDHATSCYFELRMDEPLIFFLQEKDKGVYRLIALDAYGEFVSPDRYTQGKADKILASTGSELVETGVDIFDLPAEETFEEERAETDTDALPDRSFRPSTTAVIGAFALAVLGLGAFIWQKRK